MRKVICQNCYEVLAEKDVVNHTFKYDPNSMDTVIQELDEDHCLLTICCPKCGCMVQVKV